MLRRKRGPSAFALPFGPLIPLLAAAGCFLFLNGIGRADALFSLWTLLVGLALHGLWRLVRKPALASP